MRGAPVIALHEASKLYRQGSVQTVALHPCSLELLEGDFACLAGPSGSGKTTLLNLAGGIDTPSSGTVTLAGSPTTGISRTALALLRLRNVGFVFQSCNLVPVLTAGENVEYPLLLLKTGSRERRRRVGELLGQVGLSGKENRVPADLSGGEQQRVAVARALAASPRVVLADEPTANLDSATGAALVELFHELNRTTGTAFLFSSHDPLIISRAERLFTLRDGMLAPR